MKKALAIILCISASLLLDGCLSTKTASTKPAIDISNSSSKIDVYVDEQKSNNGKLELIEEQSKVYTNKIKDLTDEAIKSNEYYVNKAKIDGISIGYDKGIQDQKAKDDKVIKQLEDKLKELGVEVNYVEKD